jgi:hypothetical protein
MNRLLFASLLVLCSLSLVDVSASSRKLTSSGGTTSSTRSDSSFAPSAPAYGASSRRLGANDLVAQRDTGGDDAGPGRGDDDAADELQRLTHSISQNALSVKQLRQRFNPVLSSSELEIGVTRSDGADDVSALPLPEKYQHYRSDYEGLLKHKVAALKPSATDSQQSAFDQRFQTTTDSTQKKFRNPLQTLKKSSESVAAAAADLSSATTKQREGLDTLARLQERRALLDGLSNETDATHKPLRDAVESGARLKLKAAEALLQRNQKIADLKREIDFVDAEIRNLERRKNHLNKAWVKNLIKLKKGFASVLKTKQKIANIRIRVQQLKTKTQILLYQLTLTSKFLAVFVTLNKLEPETTKKINALREKLTSHATKLDEQLTSVEQSRTGLDESEKQVLVIEVSLKQLHEKQGSLADRMSPLRQEAAAESANEAEIAALHKQSERAEAEAADLSVSITQELALLDKQIASVTKALDLMDKKIIKYSKSFDEALGDFTAAKDQLGETSREGARQLAEELAKTISNDTSSLLSQGLSRWTGDRVNIQDLTARDIGQAAGEAVRAAVSAIAEGAQKAAPYVKKGAEAALQVGSGFVRGVRTGVSSGNNSVGETQQRRTDSDGDSDV